MDASHEFHRREGGAVNQLDGQSGSAVEYDAVSEKSVPSEFKTNAASPRHVLQQTVLEDEQEAKGPSTDNHISTSPASSPLNEKVQLSKKQLGKPPTCNIKEQPDEALLNSNQGLQMGVDPLPRSQYPSTEQIVCGPTMGGDHMCKGQSPTVDIEMSAGVGSFRSVKHVPLEIVHPRPYAPYKVRLRVKAWEGASALLNFLTPSNLAAFRTIIQYGFATTTAAALEVEDYDQEEDKEKQREAAEIGVFMPVSTPTGTTCTGEYNLVTLSKLYDPDDMCTLLISTRGFEESNMLAHQIRLSGLKAVQKEWALMDMSNDECITVNYDEEAEGGFALVKQTCLHEAREMFRLMYEDLWDQYAPVVSDRLCVMLVEPRRGGEVLIEQLRMSDEKYSPLMRELTCLFLGYGLAALSNPRPMKETSELRWCTAEFAMPGTGERVVKELDGIEFNGSKLEFTLVRSSDEQPSIWPCMPSQAAATAITRQARNHVAGLVSGQGRGESSSQA